MFNTVTSCLGVDEMHTRHSEVVYLDYHVVALCVLIVLARIVGAPTVYFSGSTRVFFDMVETFSPSTDSDSDGSWEKELPFRRIF